jgi:hypothetical protein
MKLTTLVSETPVKRTKLLITEDQLKNLVSAIRGQNEQGTINKNYIIKANSNAKKK